MGVSVTPDLAGWTPCSVRLDGGRPVIRWCFTEGIEFTDPFFEQTVDRCLRDYFRLLFWRETGIAELAEFASTSPGLTPNGFIFHVSRCGSTLVSQMLAALPSALVLSEPGPLDTMLRSGDPEDAVDRLRWIVSALGQRRRAGHTAFVVKLDAWAIFQLPLIRSAFPETPCLFVYRDPLEVLVSQLGHRGYHMIPGALPPAWLGFSPEQAVSLSAEQYIAAVLARLCEAAAGAARAGQLTLVDYGSLPDVVGDTVAPLFGIDVSERERELFKEVAVRDAKNPVIEFAADSADKQRVATTEARAAVSQRAVPAYHALEQLRLGGS
jgi:hypothetical protein